MAIWTWDLPENFPLARFEMDDFLLLNIFEGCDTLEFWNVYFELRHCLQNTKSETSG